MSGTCTGLILIFAALGLLFSDDIAYFVRKIGLFREDRPELRLSDLPIIRQFTDAPRFHAELTEIRDFLVSLQLAASLEETLSGGLIAAAEQFANRGVFGQRLKRQVESKLSISPEAVIEGLAEDFDSEELRDVVTRLKMAREGGASTSDALRVSVEDAENSIRTEIEREIKRSTVRLVIPMVVGVFFPALALAIYPLMVRLIIQLTRYQ